VGLLLHDFSSGRNTTPLPAGLEKLDWTTRVSDILSAEEWLLMDEYAGEHAQLRDLLSHSTGMPRHDLAYSPKVDIKQLVQSLRHLRPTFELREEYQYNNMMFATASYIVSKLSGQPYVDFVRSRIFSPLGMNSSTYRPQEAYESGHLADSWVYAAGPGLNETRRIPFFLSDWSDRAVGMNAGGGGVITCTRDLVQWVGTLLSEGKHPASGKQVIPSSVIDTVTGGRMLTDKEPTFPELSTKAYGAGWQRYSYKGHQIVVHSGSVPGFSSRISLLPDAKIGIISLTNGDWKDAALESLHYRAVEEEFGLDHIDWPTRFEERAKQKQRLEAKKRSEITAEPSEHAPPRLPLISYLGTYDNPGYFANITLCAWPFSIISAPCREVFDAYASTYPTFEAERMGTLYAAWPTTWSTHVRFVPDPAHPHAFKIYIDTLYPQGYGKDDSPFFFQVGGKGKRGRVRGREWASEGSWILGNPVRPEGACTRGAEGEFGSVLR